MKGADNPFLLLNCFGMVTRAKISVFVQGIRTLQDDFLNEIETIDDFLQVFHFGKSATEKCRFLLKVRLKSVKVIVRRCPSHYLETGEVIWNAY